MSKKKVRIAELIYKGVRKRCRNENTEVLKAHDENEELAICKLLDLWRKDQPNMKTITKLKGIVYDGEYEEGPGYKSLSFMIFNRENERVLSPNLFIEGFEAKEGAK